MENRRIRWRFLCVSGAVPGRRYDEMCTRFREMWAIDVIKTANTSNDDIARHVVATVGGLRER